VAISAKYFITDQRGNYIDWSAHITGFSLQGKEVQLIGGAGDDALYLQAGTSADVSNLGGGINTLYLTGALSSYAQSSRPAYTPSRAIQVWQVVRAK